MRYRTVQAIGWPNSYATVATPRNLTSLPHLDTIYVSPGSARRACTMSGWS